MAPLFVITGAMAAGKSTIAAALARRFARAAHVEGDAFLRMMVSGRATMGPVLSSSALEQLHLRQNLAMDAVRRFVAAGFTTVYEDILIGADFDRVTMSLSDLCPRIVGLAPDADTLRRRDTDRGKSAYGDHFKPEVLADALRNETQRTGLWLDTSAMTVDDVVRVILSMHPIC